MTSPLAAVAERAPARPAVVMAESGDEVSFLELEERSNRFAQLMRSCGLGVGGSLAVLIENHPRFFEVVWGAKRAGLYTTAINRHLSPAEASYVLEDCGAGALVSSMGMRGVVDRIDQVVLEGLRSFMVDGVGGGWSSLEEALATQQPRPVADGAEGEFMLYSSGTTGRPKGIRRPLKGVQFGVAPEPVGAFLDRLGLGDGDRYLCPAPLYHAAPAVWSMNAQRRGATVVVMERFDAELALKLIDRHQITHAQFVPTMFVRMLKLDGQVRRRYDVSSLRGVVHAAAPCPPEVKRQMIEWWGPIISEFWSSTKGAGATWVDADDWLEHPGTVGRPIIGQLVVRDPAGRELPPGEVGVIWARDALEFEYHHDPQKTADARNEQGEVTVGDMGYLDRDGYLYLTDRKHFMIISGGVNIYPQEVENHLIGHPKVADVAVIGVPNDEFGEEVKAVVEPVSWNDAGPELANELIAYCRAHLGSYKCPRSVDFERSLPRLDTGKLYKSVVRDRYWH